MNRDPQPENRDPKITSYVFMGREVFKKPCRKCKQTFDTLNPDRDICAECVHKSSLDQPNPTQE